MPLPLVGEDVMGEVEDGNTIVVWVSYGAASAIAAYETLRRYGDRCDVRLVNNPVAEEDEDNLRFGRDLAAWLGRPIIEHRNPAYPQGSAVDVWDRRGAMVFPHGAPCTVHLKKEARQDYERQHWVDWHVLGFTADERHRYERFVLTERSNVLPVLIAAGLTKNDCAAMLMRAGIALPRVYAEGYPNANCIGCVKATSPTYWNLVRRTRPEVFAARSEQSRRLGVRLVRHRGKRVFLDELPSDANARPLNTLTAPECGLFCEEPIPKTQPPDPSPTRGNYERDTTRYLHRQQDEARAILATVALPRAADHLDLDRRVGAGRERRPCGPLAPLHQRGVIL